MNGGHRNSDSPTECNAEKLDRDNYKATGPWETIAAPSTYSTSFPPASVTDPTAPTSTYESRRARLPPVLSDLLDREWQAADPRF